MMRVSGTFRGLWESTWIPYIYIYLSYHISKMYRHSQQRYTIYLKNCLCISRANYASNWFVQNHSFNEVLLIYTMPLTKPQNTAWARGRKHILQNISPLWSFSIDEIMTKLFLFFFWGGGVEGRTRYNFNFGISESLTRLLSFNFIIL